MYPETDRYPLRYNRIYRPTIHGKAREHTHCVPLDKYTHRI